MTRRPLVLALCVLAASGALAACSSSTAPAAPASPSSGPTAPVRTTAAAAAPAAASPSPNASQAGFAALMTSHGFFPGGTPAYAIDSNGQVVCANLRTEPMSAEIAYEQSVDENTLTGMTTKADIVTFVRDSVEAWCPKYAGELPAK